MLGPHAALHLTLWTLSELAEAAHDDEERTVQMLGIAEGAARRFTADSEVSALGNGLQGTLDR